MLPLMLMLVADPLSQLMTPPTAPPAAPSVQVIDAEDALAGVIEAQAVARRDCRNGEFQQARTAPVVVRGEYRGQPFTVTTRGPAPVLNDLMFRQGDPVEMTLLLERRIGGCSVPISYDVAPGGRLPSFPARAD